MTLTRHSRVYRPTTPGSWDEPELGTKRQIETVDLLKRKSKPDLRLLVIKFVSPVLSYLF